LKSLTGNTGRITTPSGHFDLFGVEHVSEELVVD
jgi:hypothetical protein